MKSDQIRSVAQSCPTLCDPMNCSTPGLPVHHQLPEFTQTHVHRVSDAIQPSHPLSSPSPPAPNPSQLHSLFQWVNSSHEQNTEKQINRKKKKKRWKEGILMPLIFMSHNYLTHYKCQLWMLLINVWINEFKIHDELILKICIYYNISIHIFWNSLYVIIFIILQHLWTGKIEYIHPNLSQSSF